MEINDLIEKFSDSTENQCKAIFSTLFITANRLQTVFDHNIPEITLKQFMLLTLVRQSKEQLTLTKLGQLLGCSRQNIKKLAYVLEKKGFVEIKQNGRAISICSTMKLEHYFETVFKSYQKELKYLFEVYNVDEIEQFFQLMMKLYDGIEHLEKRGIINNDI